MSRPVYERASSTNLRPGTAARALEGKLAIVSAFLGEHMFPDKEVMLIVMCRSQEDLEVWLKTSTVFEYKLS